MKQVDEMATKILQRGSHEVQDELESTLLQAYATFQTQFNPHRGNATVPPSATQALLCGILIQPPNSASSATFMSYLTTITTDGYASLVGVVHRLVNDSYHKLLDQPRTQLIWLLKQLINLEATDIDNLCLLLLRQIAGGDLSPTNTWLATQMLDVLNSNMDWLIGNSGLLTSAVYTYLRLLPDHCIAKSSTAISELRQAEVKFCTTMLRDHFQECLAIGRDLVRVLQDVANIPDFEPIWRDLLSNPAAFKAPGFTDISQLYAVRTPARYLQSRLTPEMESQIKFMLTHVRMGNQRRYQSWFTQRFLPIPESESLVSDLLRYICCVHHPSNQILQSDILPRWALVGWLLKCCKSCHVEANAKLALLYDWLFFVHKTDNIMNIEPAILVMVHSIPKYADMTNSLLEFLFLLMDNYDPVRKDLVQRGVATSIDILVGKGVVRSLEPLCSSQSVASWLREKLAQHFPAYCKGDAAENLKALKPKSEQSRSSREDSAEISASGSQSSDDKGETDSVSNEPVSRKRRRTSASATNDPGPNELEKLSKALAQSQDAAVKVLETSLASLPSEERAEKFAVQVAEVLKKGGYEMFSPLLSAPSSKPEGDETMSITSTLFRLYVGSCFPHMKSMLLAWSSEGYSVGARLLCYVSRLSEELENVAGLLNNKDSDGSKAEAGGSSSSQSDISEEEGEATEKQKVQGPKRVQAHDSKNARQRSLLHQSFHTAVAEGFKAYEEFLKAQCDGNLDEEVRTALLSDLKTCLAWNISRLQRVLPSVYRYLPNLSTGNEKLLYLVVSVMTPSNILNMELRLAFGELSVVGSQDNAGKLIKASTSWDSMEQLFLWKLLTAEVQGRGTLTGLEVLKVSGGVINPEADTEAVSGLLSLARSSSPGLQLASALLCLPVGFSKLVVGVFASWIFGSFLQLVNCMNQLNAKLSKEGAVAAGLDKLSPAALDALLGHLDEFEMNQTAEEQRRATIKQALLKIAAGCGVNNDDGSSDASA